LLALIRVYEKEVGSSRIARRIVPRSKSFHRARCAPANVQVRSEAPPKRRIYRTGSSCDRCRAPIERADRVHARARDNNERADISSLGGGLLRHLDMHSRAVRAGDAQDEARSRSARPTRYSRRSSATIIT